MWISDIEEEKMRIKLGINSYIISLSNCIRIAYNKLIVIRYYSL